MSDMDHERSHEELAPYLLGALEPGEVAQLEQHLAACPECRAELSRLRPAMQVLPDSVERREAPSQLRDRVMAEVRTDAKRLQAGRSRWASIPLRPAVGFAAVLLIGIAVAGYAIRDGDSGDGASPVAAGQASGASAKMVRNGNSGTLHLTRVRELPPGRVLQAWVRRGEQIEAVGPPFAPSPDGTATAVIDDMRDVDAVMVTAEPRGSGGGQPTSAPLVSVSVSQ